MAQLQKQRIKKQPKSKQKRSKQVTKNQVKRYQKTQMKMKTIALLEVFKKKENPKTFREHEKLKKQRTEILCSISNNTLME